MTGTEISLKFETEFWQKSIMNVVGIDEAGRGPLAGPVIAAAVVFSREVEMIPEINDSKKLTDKKRELLFDKIKEQAVSVGTGIVWPEEIDRINILQATFKAMRMAVGSLKVKPGHLLIDGNRLPDKVYPSTAIVGGDRKCYSIAAASIIAKVTRDRMMTELDSVFPGYGLAGHKGYGTKKHCEAIQQLFPSPLHRKTFARVKEFVPDIHSLKSKQLGKYGEDLAAWHLYKNGFKIIDRNFHIGAYGELDIIAQKDNILSFVEVKTSSQKKFGTPESWVDERKMQQLGQLADAYLGQHPELEMDCRFDVIGIDLTGKEAALNHIKDAFRL